MIHKDIDVGYYTAFGTLLARLVWPTLTLGFMLALVQRGRASWSRLVQLQDTKTDIPDGAGQRRLAARPSEPARVEVKNLTIKIGDRAAARRRQPHARARHRHRDRRAAPARARARSSRRCAG